MSEAAKEYGRALSDLAAEEGLEEQLLTEVRAVRTLFSENSGYARLLSDPVLPKAERCAMLETAFGGSVHRYLLNFLKMITERGYAAQTISFLDEYERLYCERHGIVTAQIISAAELSEEQRERLTKKLETMTGKRIFLSCRVDPSLIGGLRLYVNNTLFEGSVRAKLDSLRASLQSVTL